ncbi:hypothetical protein [Xanthomonas citri]|uniref:hypothetical protein n=1 Tax=Xanthomonas citri TaxID=346 RepID=UPI0009C3C305|nr:hypothetical protein [Xanthomonas citri]AMV03127.1 hypothetical protein TP50_12245 [Xanthomonas citri pv. aurantifolii]TBW93143.1 hypothetical protein TP49_22470 [Xanthomonas citri pv. aurantifolii]
MSAAENKGKDTHHSMNSSEDGSELPRFGRLKRWWRGLSPVARVYILALVSLLISFAITWAAPRHAVAQAFAYLSFALFGLCFLKEAYHWVIPKLQLPLVKLIVAAGGVMAAAAATGVSRMAVNEATGQDPAAFTTTVAFLVPLSFVPVLAALVAVGGVFVVPATMIGSLGKAFFTWSKPKDLDVMLSLARVFGCVTVIAASASLLYASSPLFPTLNWLAGHGAMMFDLQPNVACAEDSKDRALRLTDDVVILGRATDDGLHFVRRDCPLAAESLPLGAPASLSNGTQ